MTKLVEELLMYASMSNHPDLLIDAADEITDLRTKNARLRAALEPFSKALKGNWSHQPDEMKISAGWENGGIDIRLHFTLGDFRRATAAMEGK